VNFKKDILKVFVLVLIICMLFGSLIYRPSIQTATYDELIVLDDIGIILASRVMLYIQDNPECELNELDCIPGIGEKRIETLSKEWK